MNAQSTTGPKTAPAKAKKKTKKPGPPLILYGVLVDFTGVVVTPGKLRLVTKPLPRVKYHPSAKFPFWEIGDDTIVRRAGERGHGDGRDYRVTFCDHDKRRVELWLKGVLAQQKLLRASVTKGK